ncbi:MCE family protein [Gordonia pseudamarae]|jgi:phospholipid/cholesterol/gamma-HCH transport system substrate-binding protein|uniref:MCE family protein n=1 Tax=Gordonia pseudamarae TaxID=2831662 RepID=A0ABX6IF82_9ACTN|nr:MULTISPECIES: MCE family protein [Gordonia]MBD0023377.1 MCE family protein [Gordonia sp. (in: high G+C Gram-positive bacteria)]QHN25586.1 MCE family protein [Gordonia pseudamarae]QHN34517.1 MCE family protein [Gordonia pseudamarae]
MTRLPLSVTLKALAYVVVGIVAAVVMSNTLRVPVHGDTTVYRIQFYDAEGLTAGNPVSMSGVRIGRVDSVDLRPQKDGTALAEVKVTVASKYPLPDKVHATVRYGDMLGARYIALESTPDTPARTGNRIPVGATTAAINLTALMNGFQPLFSALDPDQANQLARGFVDTFEGRGGSVQTLLEQISTMGQNLAANGAVFTRLVSNLNALMTTVSDRSPELTELFDGLGKLSSTLIGDNGQLTTLLDSGDKAVTALADMMTAAGSDFETSLKGLTNITSAWIPQTGEFTTFLANFPTLARKLNQSGRYGGFIMLYLCNFTLEAAGLSANIFGPLHSPSCMPRSSAQQYSVPR